jgi:hypothetical protein
LQNQDAYEISTWVLATERSSSYAESSFGFEFDNEFVGFNANPYGGYVEVRYSEGFYGLGFDEEYGQPDMYHENRYNLGSGVWHQINVSAYTPTGSVSVWYDGQLLAYNWPAFTANETPSFYYLGCYVPWTQPYVYGITPISGTIRQYIDDVTVDIAGASNDTVPEFSSLLLLPLLILATLFAAVTYRKKLEKDASYVS